MLSIIVVVFVVFLEGHLVDSCGISSISPRVTYIVGGTEATPHSLPWVVSVNEAIYGIDMGHECGGSIIGRRWVLTAAHCIELSSTYSYLVAVGVHSQRRADPLEKVYQVKRVHMHPGWDDEDPTRDDIALLELATAIEYNDHVQPICLPERRKEWAAGTSLLVAGWGDMQENGVKSDKLRQVYLPYVDRTQCARNPDFEDGDVHGDVICAGGFPQGGKDACQGDSGGPLMTSIGGRWVQAGIVSWGYGCADPGIPGIYTHVANYRDWIDGIIG